MYALIVKENYGYLNNMNISNMKEVFINKENLLESEIDEVVVRTKALIINDKERI